MKTLQIASIVGVLTALLGIGVQANAQPQCFPGGGRTWVSPCIFGTLGGVELVVTFLPGGFDVFVAEVSAQAVNPDAALVTFTNLGFSGGVHQVWDSVIMGPTAQGPPEPSAFSPQPAKDCPSRVSDA